jgi:hypothetical protein
MTLQEFEYIRRAMTALESGEHSAMSRAKILMTVSEITGRAAEKIREDLNDRVDQNMANAQLMKVLTDA